MKKVLLILFSIISLISQSIEKKEEFVPRKGETIKGIGRIVIYERDIEKEKATPSKYKNDYENYDPELQIKN